MAFTVTKVIDGDTFDVRPAWKLKDGKGGNRVRIASFNATEASDWGGKTATQKLKNLIEGEEVELKNPVNISYGRLVCDVFINGKDIKDRLN